MLNVMTQRNPLHSSDEKDVYCFRSTNSETYTNEMMIQEMLLNYTSTVTEADALAVLTAYFTIVARYVAKGYVVQTPFCTFRASANGTCTTDDGYFQPGTGDHRVDVIFCMDGKIKAQIEQDISYKQVEPEYLSDPKIRKTCILSDGAEPKKELDAKSGDDFQLKGKNLSFDLADEKQGVFLSLGGKETKVTKFSRLGSNIIIGRIPNNIGAGSYKIVLRTKPRKDTYADSIATDAIEISA